jgi:CheY-like chemotaxis protein
VIEPVLVAPRGKLEQVARDATLDLADIRIEDVPHSHAAAARAVALAASGHVDALMKGSLHTDELMAAVVAATSGLRTARRISHCYLMHTPAYPRPFIITDGAVNIAPTLEEKADILRNAIDLAHIVGVALPRVAILAAVEMVNPRMQATLDAAALCKMADRGQITGAVLDGPLAFDNAISAAAARIKGIVSEVAGRADILLVPDLESGNMLAKQLEHLGYRPTVYTDPRVALAEVTAAPRRFRAIVTDLTMPHLSGVELVQGCRSAGGDLPALIITGYGTDALRATLQTMPRCKILPKPFEGVDLARMLHSVLRGVTSPPFSAGAGGESSGSADQH